MTNPSSKANARSPAASSPDRRGRDPLPKLCGADIELGNFILGSRLPGSTGYEASRALLREFDGYPKSRRYRTGCNCHSCRTRRQTYYEEPSDTSSDDPDRCSRYNPQDWGRKFLAANGGCVYIDLDHLELCLPEVLCAFDHVAAWHAMLRLARDAQVAANARLPEGQRIEVLVNNSDGEGHSYGSHTNFLVSRPCFRNIFERKLHHQALLASYLVSSICCTGAGKVGAENRRPHVDYQLTQRGDFFECLCGPQTTYDRPLVNSRDEGLAEPHMARLHVIFFDNTLCHVASLLKVGVTQIALAMVEQERVPTALILDDPLRALLVWGHDPGLGARVRVLSGARYTVVEEQLAIFDHACRFVATGRAEGIVPRACEIMALWEHTLLKLRARDFNSLAGSLDWVLKRQLIKRAMSQHRGLTWASPEAKHLDHLYSSLDPHEGLYWAMERSGQVQTAVSDAETERLVHEPPTNTRAWLRAKLLRTAPPGDVARVDWNRICFRLPRSASRAWSSYETFKMSNPLGFTQAKWAQRLQSASSVEELIQPPEQPTLMPEPAPPALPPPTTQLDTATHPRARNDEPGRENPPYRKGDHGHAVPRKTP